MVRALPSILKFISQELVNCIDFTSFSGILMIMNQGGTTTVTDKDTSALIETLKATNEELLK